MADELVLWWYSRFHATAVSEEYNLDDAIKSAFYSEEDGEALTQCIEAWGNDYYIKLGREELRPHFITLRAEQASEAEKRLAKRRERPLYRIHIKHPERDHEVILEDHSEFSAATEAYSQYLLYLGDRVRLETVRGE